MVVRHYLWLVVMRGSILSTCEFFFFQAEDGIRDLVRSRGLGDVYKRQRYRSSYGQNLLKHSIETANLCAVMSAELGLNPKPVSYTHLTLPTSDLV